jgi:hypothetical protein
MMSKSTARNLTVGAPVVYRDLWAVKNYEATVTAVSPESLTVNVPTISQDYTYDLTGDLTQEIPLNALL